MLNASHTLFHEAEFWCVFWHRHINSVCDSMGALKGQSCWQIWIHVQQEDVASDALMLTAAVKRQLLGPLGLPEQQSGYQGDRERAAAREEEKRWVSAPVDEQRWDISISRSQQLRAQHRPREPITIMILQTDGQEGREMCWNNFNVYFSSC